MVVAIVVLFVLLVAQQLFNAFILKAVAKNVEDIERLCDDVAQLADSVLELAKRLLKGKKVGISVPCPMDTKGRVHPPKGGVVTEKDVEELENSKIVPVAKKVSKKKPAAKPKKVPKQKKEAK